MKLDKSVAENMRGIVYRQLSRDPRDDVVLTKRAVNKVAEMDAKEGKQMDPLSIQQIGGPHDETARAYAQKYTKVRPKYSGRRKKTRRVKKSNGRK